MLDSCLEYLCEQMNQSIKTIFDLTENIVIVSPPSKNEERDSISTQNKVLLFISNLERDTFSKPGQMAGFQPQQRTAITNKPLYLSISVVVAANFSGSNYTDGLKVLSHLLAFVHRHPVFNRQNSPDLPETIEQISLEMINVPENHLSHMWSMLGSHYLPSSVYRVRAVIPNSETILSQTGKLRHVQTNVVKKEG